MGQHVGVFQNIRQRETRKDDMLYMNKSIQQKDVTSTPTVNSNSNSNVQLKQTSFIKETIYKDKVDLCNVTKYNSKIIPKKGWIGYQLVHLQQKGESISKLNTIKKQPTARIIKKNNNNMNSIYTTNSQPIHISDDIEQLITMMKNHRVSDDTTTTTTTTSPILNTCDFNFSNGNKLLTPQHTPPTLNSLPEFKFSFPTHVSSKALDSLKISNHNQSQPKLQLIKPTEAETESKNARINARKILPLPKPRIRKSESINTTNNIPQLVFRTKDDTCSNVVDRDNTKKKLKCSKDTEKIVVVDNKRKERNWKDTNVRVEPKTTTTTTTLSTTTNNSTITTTITKTATNKNNSASRTNKIVLNTTTITAVVTPTSNTNNTTKKTEKKPPNVKKKGKQLNNNNDTNKNKKNNRNKQKKTEDMAPGGFLSSDVTLFDNPISDDWICLFCQYDILFSGYHETKKKNNRRQKKDNINSKKNNNIGGEGSSISSGSSASDDDHHVL